MEKNRLRSASANAWKKWGPYLSDRQWGTVREDYSPDGSAWESITHEDARSNAYRWGEEGIGGISDDQQNLCFAWSFWNGKDPILKERLFGLTGNEGNHGEDVKEQYYYLDSTPTHSYMKMLYKYPFAEFPYAKLLAESRNRSKKDPEYELVDTGVFDKSEYFDIFMEYAKCDKDDILAKAVIFNKSEKPQEITVIPTFWFRNSWRLHYSHSKPELKQINENEVLAFSDSLGKNYIYFDAPEEVVFCDNETNYEKVHGAKNSKEFFKDGINNYVVDADKYAVRTKKFGTKAGGIYKFIVEPNDKVEVRVRFADFSIKDPFLDFNNIFKKRKQDADEFYEELQQKIPNQELKVIQRQAYAGMLWSKQFYYFNVKEWLDGDDGRHSPPKERKTGRNSNWRHLHNSDIISMPDKWEYPWYAAWDLAFHTIPLARVDVEFAKNQLLLFLSERYLHPNGQIPAYEWNFSDVNPPVHAWAVLRVFHMDKKQNGVADMEFLEKCFHKLMLNFTWWVNRKDSDGNNVFEGGFLGLDNIGVFDRSAPLPTGGSLEQADGTSWMAMFSLVMLRISLELADQNAVYQDMAIKFFEHFLLISEAIYNTEDGKVSLWDDEDHFFYDVLNTHDDINMRLKIRSMVGLTPLFAVETLKDEIYHKLPALREKMKYYSVQRPNLFKFVSRWDKVGKDGRRLFSILRDNEMKKVISYMVDESEFLSDYGIRALSKFHKNNPYEFHVGDEVFRVSYQPGESDSYLFGGNSNWRGPIWFPVNYMLIESLWKYSAYYDDDFKIEYPTGSGKEVTLEQLADEISKRLIKIFQKDTNGNRPVYSRCETQQKDSNFSEHILFYEYFHGDTGAGIGASHQTGWTGLVADLIHKLYND